MISILMATYNGEKYIEEQLDSLLNQSVQDFEIFIRDDCSNDRTFEILQNYHQRFPNKIFIEKSEKNSGSAKHTFFSLLLSHKDADYVMLCDQDDVWNPDKIEITLNEMKKMQQQYGKETPLLVHTDLTVVDSGLKVINPSFKKMLDADYSRIQLNHLVNQNTLTGCTAMFNKSLCNLIKEEPKYCVMHDWWIMLVASCFGHVSSLNTQTIQYRQHSDNSVGVADVKSLKYQIHKMFRADEIRTAINRTYLQAQCFLDTYSDKLTEDQIEILKKYVALPQQPKLQRIRTLFQEDFFKHSFARKIAHIIYV
ncbi:glycosyltransferase family 2 protein [Caproiciproducens galactitolivorans]|uniref:glycosyltransferase family 2 protein n=1 Tax=Caproiciproducens galactitolivorans TaxID=642589 RepID=UPI002408F2C2|nr:glycosyltransferase family 2 protein [Caproiciproducens galactitolivorans]